MTIGATRAAHPQGYRLAMNHGAARTLVLRHGWNTLAYQILNPGIAHWFAPCGGAVVGYVAAAGAWVTAGSPICAPEQLSATAAAFEAAAARQGRRVYYFGAQKRLAEALAAHGPIAQLRLGAQPVWDPHGWPAIIAGKASLRAQLARARNKGLSVAAWPTAQAAHNPQIQRCLEEWLATRGLPPLRFLVEPGTLAAHHGDAPQTFTDRRVFVAQSAGVVLAYLVATPIPQRSGWLLEQVVRGRAAPNGTAELLIDAAMRALAAEGAAYVTLGLAPLSAHGAEPDMPLPLHIQWLLAWMRAHGRRFYNFAGLETFKAKLQPHSWEPVYLLSRERATSLRTLYAVAEAFAGTTPPVFFSRALVRAAGQELRWLARKTD